MLSPRAKEQCQPFLITLGNTHRLVPSPLQAIVHYYIRRRQKLITHTATFFVLAENSDYFQCRGCLS